MKEETLNEVVGKLGNFIPVFFRKLGKPIDQQAKNFMSPMQIHVLELLVKVKTSTMTELSNEMKISKQQMTPIVDKLIKSGFVTRKYSEEDRRTVNISLTTSGIDFIKKFKGEIFYTIKERIACLQGEDLDSLNAALGELLRVINKIS